MFEDELFIYIKSLAEMPSLLKLLILIAVFKPDIYKTAWSWAKYLWTNKKLEKMRTLLIFSWTQGKYSVSDIDASNRFNSLIDGQRFMYNAMNSNYCLYHNSVSGGFRNYSCRVESARDYESSWMHQMQSLPLSPFEKIIQRYSEEPIQIIDVTDEQNDYNATVLLNLSKLKATRLILIPVSIPVIEAYPGYTYNLRRVIDGVDSYVIGAVSIVLDGRGLTIPKHDIITQGKNLMAQMLSMYLANPKVLIK